MPHPRYRVALLFFLLLVLQEFGPAHFAKIKRLSRSNGLKNFAEDPNQDVQRKESGDDLEEKNSKEKDPEKNKTHYGNKKHEIKEHEKPSRRGFGSVLKNIIKVVKAGNEIIPKMVVLASIGNVVFRAIAGCCADFPKACEGNKEIDNLRTNISTMSEELDKIQLEAKNLQEWTESTSDEFATILFKLSTIVDNSETLVRKMSPAVQAAIERQTTEIKQLVRKKEAAGKKLDFLEVQVLYDSAIKTALGVAVPVFTVVIPTIPKVIKFAKTKMGLRKSYTLDDSINAALKKPPPSSPKSGALKSYLGKTKVKLDAKLNSFKETLNTKYGGAVKVMKNVGTGLSVIFGYVGAAFGIYSIVASAQSCKEKQDKVIEALEEYRKVARELENSITMAKEARQIVQDAWENMRKDITSPEFIADLKEVKNIIQSLSSQSQDLKTSAEQVQQYIEKSKVVEGYEGFYNVIRELSEGLNSLPFTLDCYTEKVQMTDYVLRECKRGTDSFDVLYQQGLEQFDTKAQNCQGKVGYVHIEPQTIKTGLAELAKKEHFNEDCILNSQLRRSLACDYKKQKYSNKEIANKKMEGVTEKQVEQLTQDCPKSSLTPADKKRVCNLKKTEKTFDDDKIAEILDLDIEDVKSVEC